jgi:hypothetical protein
MGTDAGRGEFVVPNEISVDKLLIVWIFQLFSS